MEQEWKSLKGVVENGDNYEVSPLGIVRHTKSGRINKGSVNKDGYVYLTLTLRGKCKKQYLHRILALAFIPNPDNKPMVNHKDAVKSNNSLDNLEWATAFDNNTHAIKNNLSKKAIGSANGKTKLTEEDVAAIKQLIIEGKSNTYIGKLFNVSPTTVSGIKTGTSWGHVSVDGFSPASNSKSVVLGRKNKRAKLTEEDVISIRKFYSKGSISQKELATMFGTSVSGIGHIINRRSWKHIYRLRFLIISTSN